MGIEERWWDIASCINRSGQSKTLDMSNCYYTVSSVFHYWMHERLGEGFEQKLLEAFYQVYNGGRTAPYEFVSGLPDPLAYALTHLSLALDETPAGEALGLNFLGHSVPARLPNGVPYHELQSNLTLSLTYMESALVRVTSYSPGQVIRVRVSDPRNAYVAVVTW